MSQDLVQMPSENLVNGTYSKKVETRRLAYRVRKGGSNK
jgi:hypothetical protein